MEKFKKLNLKQMGLSLVVGLSLVTGSIACKDKNTPSLSNEKLVVDNPEGPSESGGAIINDLKAKGLYDMFNEHIAEMDRNAHVYMSDLNAVFEFLILTENEGKEEFEKIKEEPLFIQISESKEFNKVLNPEILLEIAKDLDGGKKMQAALERLDQAKVLVHESCKAKEYIEGKYVLVEKDASADYEDQICFSATRILAKTSISNLPVTLRSLFMHELTHKAGIKEERKAQTLEALFWFLNVNKVEKHYWYVSSVENNKVSFTNYFQEVVRNIDNLRSKAETLKNNYLRHVGKNYFFSALSESEKEETKESELKTIWVKAWQSTYKEEWEHTISIDQAADIMLLHRVRLDRSKEPDLPETLLSIYEVQKKLYEKNKEFYKYQLDEVEIEKYKAFQKIHTIPGLWEILNATQFNHEVRLSEKRTFEAFRWIFNDLYYLYQFSSKESRLVDYDNFIKGDKFEFCSYVISQAEERNYYNTEEIKRICSDLFLDEIEISEEGIIFALRWLVPYAEANFTEIFEDVKKRIHNRQVFECSTYSQSRCEDVISGDKKDDEFYHLVEGLKSLKRKPSYEKVVSVFQNNLKWAIEYYKATYVENRGGKNE